MGAPIKLSLIKLQMLPLALRVQVFSAHFGRGFSRQACKVSVRQRL